MAFSISNSGVIVNTTLDGRTVEKLTTVYFVEAGDVTLSVEAQILKTIDAIYHIEVDSTVPPASVGTISHKTVTGNVVALTLNAVSVDTTLMIESVLLGY